MSLIQIDRIVVGRNDLRIQCIKKVLIWGTYQGTSEAGTSEAGTSVTGTSEAGTMGEFY